MTPPEVAAAFVARINEHDLEGLGQLMTEDHVCIDACDNHLSGRATVCAAWKQYFAMIPDYWVKVDIVLHQDHIVALFGRAGGTYATNGSPGHGGRWDIPTAWQAEIRDTRVASWQVYADNLPMRRLMGETDP
jgi:limonene-1,2-epoxide hydrolase